MLLARQRHLKLTEGRITYVKVVQQNPEIRIIALLRVRLRVPQGLICMRKPLLIRVSRKTVKKLGAFFSHY